MQRLIFILLVLFASVWLGIVLVQHPGSAYFIAPPWSVEMPLWFFCVSIFLIFLIFYFLLRMAHSLGFSWYRIKNWWHNRSEHRSYSKTQQGLLSLVEQKWILAERLLLEGVAQSIEPLINYLGAAKAAFEQEAFDRCDNYLNKAHKVAPQAEIAIGIMRAKFQLKRDQLEQALATLNHLRQLSPKHAYVLSLLERVYTRLSDWQDLLLMVPNLRQANVITKEEAQLLEKNIYCELLRSNPSKNLEAIQKIWQDIPRAVQKNPEVILAYVKQLQRFPEQTAEAESLIRHALKKQWLPELVEQYGNLLMPIPSKQLAIAEEWLNYHGQSAVLLFVLGRLSMRCQLWGKARDYYERGLALEPNAEASLEYGKLLEQLGESEQALLVYKEAIGKVATSMLG